MSTRKKFKVLYPMDHYDPELRGKPYKTSGKNMIVMNQSGVFFVYSHDPYYPSIRKLSDILPRYDVVFDV